MKLLAATVPVICCFVSSLANPITVYHGRGAVSVANGLRVSNEYFTAPTLRLHGSLEDDDVLWRVVHVQQQAEQDGTQEVVLMVPSNCGLLSRHLGHTVAAALGLTDFHMTSTETAVVPAFQAQLRDVLEDGTHVLLVVVDASQVEAFLVAVEDNSYDVVQHHSVHGRSVRASAVTAVQELLARARLSPEWVNRLAVFADDQTVPLIEGEIERLFSGLSKNHGSTNDLTAAVMKQAWAGGTTHLRDLQTVPHDLDVEQLDEGGDVLRSHRIATGGLPMHAVQEQVILTGRTTTVQVLEDQRAVLRSTISGREHATLAVKFDSRGLLQMEKESARGAELVVWDYVGVDEDVLLEQLRSAARYSAMRPAASGVVSYVHNLLLNRPCQMLFPTFSQCPAFMAFFAVWLLASGLGLGLVYWMMTRRGPAVLLDTKPQLSPRTLETVTAKPLPCTPIRKRRPSPVGDDLLSPLTPVLTGDLDPSTPSRSSSAFASVTADLSTFPAIPQRHPIALRDVQPLLSNSILKCQPARWCVQQPDRAESESLSDSTSTAGRNSSPPISEDMLQSYEVIEESAA